jgi:hypothetical protein
MNGVVRPIGDEHGIAAVDNERGEREDLFQTLKIGLGAFPCLLRHAHDCCVRITGELPQFLVTIYMRRWSAHGP